MRLDRIAIPLAAALLAIGCDDGSRAQLENELILMQERLVELETQVADAQAHASRLDTAVGQMEAHVADVERAVIDLSAWVSRDYLVDTEATLGLAKTKLVELRQRSDVLNAALRPAYDEDG